MFNLKAIILVATITTAYARYENIDALPTPVNYFEQPVEHSSRSEDSNKKPEPKFGLQIGYGNDLQGFSGNGMVGTFTPLKIDLGGLVLGTVIGIGAVLLLPKIHHIFSSDIKHGSSSPYGRSVDALSDIGSTISRVDQNLQEMDIDSSACFQKAACMLFGYLKPSFPESAISSSSESMLNFFMESFKVKNAIKVGVKGEDCSKLFPRCSFNDKLLMENKQ